MMKKMTKALCLLAASLLLTACHRTAGDAARQIDELYAEAIAAYDGHDRPRAMTSALRCVALAEQHDTLGLRSMAKACSLLTSLFHVQLDNPSALAYALKGYRAAQRGGFLDPIYIADVATAYMRLGQADSTRHYYAEALRQIRAEESLVTYADIVGEMLIYCSVAEPDSAMARQCLGLLDSLPAERRPHNYDGSKAKFFETYGPLDSAIYYYKKKCGARSRLFARQEASRALMDIYHRLGDDRQSARYALLYAEASDSVAELVRLEQTRDAKNEFQYRRDMEAEAEAYRKASEARQQRTLWASGFVITLLLLLLAFAYYQRRMAQRLLRQTGIIERQRVVNDNLAQLALSARMEASPSEVLDRFHAAALGQGTIGDDDWRELYAALEQLYPDWGSGVLAAWPDIKPDQLHIACLMKSGLKDAEITRLMPQNRSTVYRKITRVREHLGTALLS